MKRLKLVHTESSRGWGGQELRVLAESRGLLERGHHVSIAAPEDSRIFEEAVRHDVPRHALPIGRKSGAGFLAMRRFLVESRPDVVNTHSSTDSWLAALAARTLAAPPLLVRTRHISAPIPANPATQWLYRSATAHVVTTGEKLRDQVMREAGLDGSRVTSVPTGIDLERFKPGDRSAARAQLGLPQDAFLVGIVATLRSWKGHRYLVEAVAGVPGWHLAMVGGGPGADNLRAQTRELNMEARVHMPGNREDVEHWLHAFDVFALPSYANEGVPQAIMQAMACGLPVVTTPVGSIGEIVHDGETGLMVTPQDSSALRTALMRLEADPELRQRLGERARAFALARCSNAAMTERMEGIFQAAVHTHARR
jgi:glycosyltransferase involved in cell wall biosynthesis